MHNIRNYMSTHRDYFGVSVLSSLGVLATALPVLAGIGLLLSLHACAVLVWLKRWHPAKLTHHATSFSAHLYQGLLLIPLLLCQIGLLIAEKGELIGFVGIASLMTQWFMLSWFGQKMSAFIPKESPPEERMQLLLGLFVIICLGVVLSLAAVFGVLPFYLGTASMACLPLLIASSILTLMIPALGYALAPSDDNPRTLPLRTLYHSTARALGWGSLVLAAPVLAYTSLQDLAAYAVLVSIVHAVLGGALVAFYAKYAGWTSLKLLK